MIDSQKAGQPSDVDLIVEAAREAGRIALGFFRQSPEVWWKNNGQSPVSAADYAANESLSAILRSARPDYGWLSEETDDDADRLSHPTVFVVDPIDGTRGFLAGSDLWCVSVAVVTDGRPVAGVLYAPSLDELFVASAGGKALKNGEPIHVSNWVGDDPHRLATGEDMLKGFDPDFRKTVERVKHIPSLAYRLAMVADGRLEGTIVKRNSHDWDLAAADLILERAGGALVDLSGNALRYNRAAVSHEELCGAPVSQLPEFLRQLSHRRDG
ncbi:3'(2'),5'-bisphosphate nucleotidase CysQ [Rhizobium sp. P44RR-XXIV]|uniref:3'(2'),5'-bisphosphate nucleotidase CysQ n=1 Tax=Rhizobium sp. P44RR-XXIV TaxID=1921145 RepID=UPI0009868CE9|nr:3'(2'),5'-bisphosphate nucleotidase CysQ [Rhizobium sp. P44RR-XXIV]TIX91884.1 3'(2'),5'-bisphosphate nucleotidase CysQ [Rhizobium sp. P44RR-XXIV]